MTAPKKLTGLIPQAYEHPSDNAALNVLGKTPGLDLLVRKLNEWGFEPMLRVQLTGSYLHVLPDHFPDLAEIIHAACDTLDLPSVPDLYIAASGELNAATAGVKRPLIYVTSAAVEIFTPEELLFVIAHEVGHVKSNHVLYYQMADYFPVIVEMIPGGEYVGAPLRLALLRYQRMAEFTADRAGLLGCQNVETALRALMKLAGLPHKYHASINTEDFIRQAREFQAMDSDKANWIAKGLSVMGATHPWTVMRAQQLLQWIDSGEYDAVVKNPTKPRVAPAASAAGFCNQCGSPLQLGALFCSICGHPVPGADVRRRV